MIWWIWKEDVKEEVQEREDFKSLFVFSPLMFFFSSSFAFLFRIPCHLRSILSRLIFSIFLVFSLDFF